MAEPEAPVTQMLNAADPGERQRGFERIYEDLVRIARAELSRHRRGETLNTRALVNEAYLKLFAGASTGFENRRHFYATAARAMRQVVIDYARARVAEKRGAGAATISLDSLAAEAMPVDAQAEQFVMIDAALTKLAALDARLTEVLELRFFTGLEVKEIAVLLGVSEPTIKRDTRAAKAFVQRELALGVA